MTLHTKVRVPAAVVGTVGVGRVEAIVVGHPPSVMIPFVRTFGSLFTEFRSVGVTKVITATGGVGPSTG